MCIRDRFEEGRSTGAYFVTRTTFALYVIHEMVKEYGHKVVRLPPYYWYINTIDLIKEQVKERIANNTIKLSITEITELNLSKLSKRLRKTIGKTLPLVPLK